MLKLYQKPYILVTGEINLFEASNQLNKLFRKMIHCFEALETPHAGDACWSKLCKCNKNSGQNMQKNSFYKPIVFMIHEFTEITTQVANH